MASSVLSGDQLNFTRIVIACVDEIKVVLADILSCEIKPGDLPKAIRSCSNLITGMFKLRTEQMNICCPSPSGAPDYYKFDVTLLYALIRNLCPQLKPTQGWGKAPSIKDMQIGDDIERLREIRNTMHAHVNSSKVDDATFSSHWQSLENIFCRIQTSPTLKHLSVDYGSRLTKLKNGSFFSEDMEKYKILLEAMLHIYRDNTNIDLPRITIRGNANVVCGNNTSFEAELDMCSSSNNWPVTWEKIIGNKTEQININGDKYKGSSTMRLIIPRVLKEDQGEYRAFVDRENNGTHIKIPSNSILLTVLGEKPNLEKLSLSKEQNDIKIICKFRVDEQTPNADQILWEKNGQSLQNCLRMHVDHSKTDSTLTISRATGDDFGEYSCNVSNAVGTSKECIVLGISVVTAIKELSVPFGDSALIQAKIVSCPPVENISWQKSTSGESHAEKFQTINVNLSKYSGTTLDSTNPKLVIRQTTFQDRVFYQLLVSNGIGRCVSSSTFLDVKGSPPNVFTGHETNFQKQSVKLKCNVYCADSQLTTLTWTKNDECVDILGSDGKYRGGNQEKPTLTIESVNAGDAGIYLCRATNALGTTTSEPLTLGPPDITLNNERINKDSGIMKIQASIKSIPDAFKVEWKVQTHPDDEFHPINLHDETYKGTTISIPNPVLVVNRNNSNDLKIYKMEVTNFIGVHSVTTQEAKEGDQSSIKRSKNSSFAIYDDSDTSNKIKFNKCRLSLIKGISESDLTNLKDSLKAMTSVDLDSLNSIHSVREFIHFLIDETYFTEQDMIIMQYLMRTIERLDLEQTCIAYATKRKGKLCYFQEEKRTDGCTRVKLHVVDDIENFTKLDSLIDTVAAIAECDPKSIKVVGILKESSFFIELEVERKAALLLSMKTPRELKKFAEFKVDRINIGSVVINIGEAENEIINTVNPSSTEETINACRACRLLLGPCTDQLRDVLLHYVPLQNFSNVIKQKINNLSSCLTAAQMTLILPRGSSYSGNYSDMDISLLYILLRNICGIPPHRKGWGNNPDHNDRSLSANIERFRIARNNCFHYSSPALSNSDFNKIWSTVREAVMDFDVFLNNRNQHERGVHFLEKETIDPFRDRHYIEELRKQAEEDASTQEIDHGVKQKEEEIDADKMENQNKIQWLEDDVSILRNAAISLNVKAIHEEDILQWKEDDRVFYESHNFLSFLEKVKNQTHVTFVGVPGSGKTATARHIALMLQQEGYEIVPIKDIRKLDDYCDSYNPQVFVIDDVVGVFGLQTTKLNMLTDYKDRIMKPVMLKSKTLMTCREAVYRESLVSSSFFSDENNIILLHNDVNALTNTDKKCIMKMYNIDVDLLSPACLTSASKMFPYLCKRFSSEKKFQLYGHAFFENPVPCILKELEEMKRHNKIHYVSLVLCMMNDIKLSEEILEEKISAIRDFSKIKQSVLRICKVSSHTDNFNFVVAMSEMEGTYTKLNGTEYSFVHDSMFEIVAHHFGSHFPELILKFMSSNYIANNVKLKESPIQKMNTKGMSEIATISTCSENVVGSGEFKQGENNIAVSQEKNVGVKSYDLSIRLEEKYYPMLAKRLYRDIENMELYDVFMNNVLKEPKVYQAFEDVLKTKSKTDLTSLFLSEREAVSKIIGWLMPRLKILHKLFMEVREETLENKKRGGNRLKYTLRVISWVIYYGHNQILQYILKRTEHKETEPVLFRNVTENEIPEEYLLILLGCYSGDLETVKILLRYINKDTLNMVYRCSFNGVCQGGHVRIEKELLMWANGSFPLQTFDTTPLIAACGGGHESVVKELIKAKADVNLNAEYLTPLSLASSKRYEGIVQDLIKAGAKVNPPIPSVWPTGTSSYTSLEAACDNDQSSVVKDLLELGADANLGSFYTTPLIRACKRGNIRLVKQLLDAGADANLGRGFTTPLIQACECNNIRVVLQLLDAGANVNQRCKRGGCTPLLNACRYGHLRIVEKLLDAGAGVNIQDSLGRTPLHKILLYSTETQIPVKLMVNKYGADPTVHDTEGFSSICIALIRKKIEVINQLCNSESNAQSYSLKLHLFDCLRVISQRTVMLDSKDDVVVKEVGVLDVFGLGYKFETIFESKSYVLKHLLNLGLDANQWIKLNKWGHVVMNPLLFTLIDEELDISPFKGKGGLVEKVRMLVEAGADVSVNYKMYRERLRRKNSIYNGMYISNRALVDMGVKMRPLLDNNGLSLLERTRRVLNISRKENKHKVHVCEKVLGELKKHVRRYSV